MSKPNPSILPGYDETQADFERWLKEFDIDKITADDLGDMYQYFKEKNEENQNVNS